MRKASQYRRLLFLYLNQVLSDHTPDVLPLIRPQNVLFIIWVTGGTKYETLYSRIYNKRLQFSSQQFIASGEDAPVTKHHTMKGVEGAKK
jgi:hypothetical protein